jgi:hypothetical protein
VPHIESRTVVNPSGLLMRTYLSTHLLWSGEHFARESQGVEAGPGARPRFDIRQRAYVVGAVLASVGFAEAAINEVFEDVADNHLSYVGVLDEQRRVAFSSYWRESGGRGSVLEKYQTCLGLAGCTPLAPAAEPYQSFALAIRLRNALVHFLPETSASTEVATLERQLSTKFIENPLMEGAGNPFFPDKCLGSPCAFWASAACKTFADEVFLRLKMIPNYQLTGWTALGVRVEPRKNE